jgi:hypothetical protein
VIPKCSAKDPDDSTSSGKDDGDHIVRAADESDEDGELDNVKEDGPESQRGKGADNAASLEMDVDKEGASMRSNASSLEKEVDKEEVDKEEVDKEVDKEDAAIPEKEAIIEDFVNKAGAIIEDFVNKKGQTWMPPPPPPPPPTCDISVCIVLFLYWFVVYMCAAETTSRSLCRNG